MNDFLGAFGDELWSHDFLFSKQFSTFIDLIPEAVIFSNTAGQIIQVNSQACALFGYDKKSFIELKIEDLVPKRYRAHHPEHRDYYFKHPKPRFLNNRKYDLYGLQKCGSEFHMDSSLFTLQTDKGALAVNLIRDVSEQREIEKNMVSENTKLSHIASIDLLTELPNRRFFERTLSQLLAKSKRHKRSLALLFMDLDHFKPVNDQLGHDVGDILLKAVAKRLQETLRDEDFIARIGGDEFVAIIYPVTIENELEELSNRLIDAIKQPYQLGEKQVEIGLSIGITFAHDCNYDARDIINSADKAMYDAKSQGGNCYCFST